MSVVALVGGLFVDAAGSFGLDVDRSVGAALIRRADAGERALGFALAQVVGA
jgi:hypothetical protein